MHARRGILTGICLPVLLGAAIGCRDAPGSAASAATAGPGGAAIAATAAPNGFAADPLWDDGRAEVNAYAAAERRYGILRDFTAYHIVVKEDLSRRFLVKADPGHDPSDLVTVLKMNQVIEYQTGIYTYHQMASTFHERAGMDLLKLSLTSFEWCGNSYKEYSRRGDRAVLHAHTYWDGMADVNYDLPVGPDVMLYDELPLRVRSLPQTAGTARALRLVTGQISSRADKPEIAPAALRAIAEEEVTTPAGRFRALRWVLQSGERAPDVYWVGRDAPHLLVAWDKLDGGRYRLKWTQRLAYWKMNEPGGERFLAGPAPGR